MNLIEIIKKLDQIADKDCHCSDIEQENADCDNCDISKASSAINNIAEIARHSLEEISK